MLPTASKANFSERPIGVGIVGVLVKTSPRITWLKVPHARARASLTQKDRGRKRETEAPIALCLGHLHSMHDPRLHLNKKFAAVETNCIEKNKFNIFPEILSSIACIRQTNDIFVDD